MLVLGPSGSGKSTLTLCLDGLIPHLVEGDYEGTVTVAGMIVRDKPVHVLARETGLVFQDPDAQFCTLTVEDEIAFGLENLLVDPVDIESAIDRALQEVGLPGHRRRTLETLSGGEKQRVALASVLAMGPRVLVLDEPSANLDPRSTAELFQLLRRLARDGRHTILIIEHKLDQIIDWIDNVLVLGAEGRLQCQGEPVAVFFDRVCDLEEMGVWRPQTAELVLALRRIGWEIPGSPLSVDETVASLIATKGLVERLREGWHGAPGGKGIAAAGSAAARCGPPAMGGRVLRTERLSYSYPDGHQALRDVTMSLGGGVFTAIAGANGAGKTTLASLLAGAREAPRGQIFLNDADISGLQPWAISERVGLVFQNPEHQFVTDTVFGELAFSLAPRVGRRRAGALSTEQRARVDFWLDRLGLLALAEANPFSLSQGQKRRLSVGSMLIRGQSILILDEPTLGQDELQSQRLMAMMQELRREGRTVAAVTHDMRLVAENADSLLVLNGGEVSFSGMPAEFFRRPEEVEDAGLAMPPLGEVSYRLHREAGTPNGLHTLDLFTRALGPAQGGRALTGGPQ